MFMTCVSDHSPAHFGAKENKVTGLHPADPFDHDMVTKRTVLKVALADNPRVRDRCSGGRPPIRKRAGETRPSVILRRDADQS
jgi:hypothetical protein